MKVDVLNKTLNPYISIHPGTELYRGVEQRVTLTRIGNKPKSITGIKNHRNDNNLTNEMGRKK